MLVYFILGVLLTTVFIPIVDNINSIISAFVEYVVYIFAFKIYAIKQKMNISDKEDNHNPIGFQTDAIGTFY